MFVVVFIAAAIAPAQQMLQVILIHFNDRDLQRRHTHEILTRSRNLRTIRWNTTVLRDPDGSVTGLASVGEDITERLEAEAGRARLATAVMQAGSTYTVRLTQSATVRVEKEN